SPQRQMRGEPAVFVSKSERFKQSLDRLKEQLHLLRSVANSQPQGLQVRERWKGAGAGRDNLKRAEWIDRFFHGAADIGRLFCLHIAEELERVMQVCCFGPRHFDGRPTEPLDQSQCRGADRGGNIDGGKYTKGAHVSGSWSVVLSRDAFQPQWTTDY